MIRGLPEPLLVRHTWTREEAAAVLELLDELAARVWAVHADQLMSPPPQDPRQLDLWPTDAVITDNDDIPF